MREQYSRWYERLNESESRMFNKYGIDNVDIATDSDYVKGLMTLFGRK